MALRTMTSRDSFGQLSDCSSTADSSTAWNVETLATGNPGSSFWRMDFFRNGSLISPLNDLQLHMKNGSHPHSPLAETRPDLLQFVCTTPAGTWARHEAAPDEEMNPLRAIIAKPSGTATNSSCEISIPLKAANGSQVDLSWCSSNEPDSLRSSSSSLSSPSRCSPLPAVAEWFQDGQPTHRPTSLSVDADVPDQVPSHFADNAPYNIGYLPQTWANPKRGPAKASLQTYLHPSQENGDETAQQLAEWHYNNLPIEVLEIGAETARRVGEVYLVKPLGAFLVGSESARELSWKVIAISSDDELAKKMTSIDCLQKQLPGILDLMRQWLRLCQVIKQDDEAQTLHLGGNPIDAASTKKAIDELHKAWRVRSTLNGGSLSSPDVVVIRSEARTKVVRGRRSFSLASDELAHLEPGATMIPKPRSSSATSSLLNSRSSSGGLARSGSIPLSNPDNSGHFFSSAAINSSTHSSPRSSPLIALPKSKSVPHMWGSPVSAQKPKKGQSILPSIAPGALPPNSPKEPRGLMARRTASDVRESSSGLAGPRITNLLINSKKTKPFDAVTVQEPPVKTKGKMMRLFGSSSSS
eukprot:TRINITY_DN4766_c0_g1_i1.p1 TRINITY_DN4766_c0_g1~~TRINITY_DN4766_c0_g1_i1.p1  ORF type:complete len:583 (+),score=48.27 TRINITY_DN4766_c0_g1_i1:460-2208(+)